MVVVWVSVSTTVVRLWWWRFGFSTLFFSRSELLLSFIEHEQRQCIAFNKKERMVFSIFKKRDMYFNFANNKVTLLQVPLHHFLTH